MKLSKVIIFCALLFSADSLHAQSGGAFAIEQSVVAAGGASNLSGGAFTVGGTAGQTTIGHSSTGSFYLRGGFWEVQPLAPTAAMVSVSGKVATANGLGIRNVIVTLTGPDGAIRTTVTGSFGLYQFADVEIGGIYVLTVAPKKYVIADPTRIVPVSDEIANLDFVAEPL